MEGRNPGFVALAAIVVMISAIVGAFLSALFFTLLYAYRDAILRHQGFRRGVFDVIRLTWSGPGAASRSILLFHAFLLVIQMFLGSILLLFFWAGLSLTPVMEGLCLGGLLGCCLNKFSQMFYAPEPHSSSLDKCVFIIVYICCCFVYAHLRNNQALKRFFIGEMVLYRYIATSLSLGTLVNYVCMKTSSKWIVLPVISLAYLYMICGVLRQGINVYTVCLFVLNVYLGLLVGRVMTIRNNLLTFVTCVLLGCLVWICLSVAIMNSAGVFALVEDWKKVELNCVETSLCFVICLCLCGFLLERGFSSNVALVVITLAGILFSLVNVQAWAHMVRNV